MRAQPDFVPINSKGINTLQLGQSSGILYNSEADLQKSR